MAIAGEVWSDVFEVILETVSVRNALDETATYQIKVQGRLDKSWAGQFDDMTITVESVDEGLTITTLSGAIVDQAALHGILARVRDLGLPLLLVERTGGDTCQITSRNFPK